MAKQPTIPINVVDKSLAEDDHSLIAIINEPNPVTGYEINEEQLRQLIQLPQYWITDENGRTISGVNFYEYFPRGGSGRLPIVIEKTITENGVYMAVDDHADGYSKVTVNTPVPPPAPVLIEKTVTTNGTYLPADDDADGYSKVNVETYVPVYVEKTITKDGTYLPSSDNADGYSKVTVKTAVEVDPLKPIKFYDYDGTLLHSYTKNEFTSLSTLPDNPSHPGLTSQGWNWSMNQALGYVYNNPDAALNIGQMYVTSDGNTRIYITLTDARKSPTLQLYLNANTTLDISWGDSYETRMSTSSAGYKSATHNYYNAGNYVIMISVITGSFNLQSSANGISSILWNGNNSDYSPDRAYANAIQKIEIGNGVSSIGDRAFYFCNSLQTITIPKTVTLSGSYGGMFSLCKSLKAVIIPDGITELYNYIFASSSSLQVVCIPSTITRFNEWCFDTCYTLTSITIPNGVTYLGNNSFYNCKSISSIRIPNGVLNAKDRICGNCDSLASVSLGTMIDAIGSSDFYYCSALTSIIIPDNVTTIGQYAFNGCYSLTTVTIGSRVTSIGGSAFQGCMYMESITFKPTTPPTVADSAAMGQLPTTCKIYVPNSSLNAYKTATNYPNPNTYTYIGY